MADTPSPTPAPDDMHWGVSYLSEDFLDLRQESCDIRKEMASEFAKVRGEMATGLADLHKEIGQYFRNTMLAVVA